MTGYSNTLDMRNYTLQHFTEGVRVLFLIHRKKEGGRTNNTKVKKIITTNSEEYLRELDVLLAEMEAQSEPLAAFLLELWHENKIALYQAIEYYNEARSTGLPPKQLQLGI